MLHSAAGPLGLWEALLPKGSLPSHTLQAPTPSPRGAALLSRDTSLAAAFACSPPGDSTAGRVTHLQFRAKAYSVTFTLLEGYTPEKVAYVPNFISSKVVSRVALDRWDYNICIDKYEYKSSFFIIKGLEIGSFQPVQAVPSCD